MNNSYTKELYYLNLNEKQLAFVWLGYSGIILRLSNMTLLFDISDFLNDQQIQELREPIIILYTHIHDDHFHLRTTLKISETKDTIIITCPQVYNELKEFLPTRSLKVLQPRKGIRIGDIKVFALKGNHDCEHYIYYVIYDNVKILHLGSSGYVPLSKIKSDIIYVPVGQPSSSASPEDALRITRDIQPKYSIPMHGSDKEISEYIDLVEKENIPTKIIKPEKDKLIELSL